MERGGRQDGCEVKSLPSLALDPLDRAIVGLFLVVANADQYQIAIEIGEPPRILVVVDLVDCCFDIFVKFEFDDDGGLLDAFFGQRDESGEARASGEFAEDGIEIFGIKAQDRNDTG